MNENKLTKEQIEDLNKRVKELNEELIPLLKKYKLGLGAIPFITADGRIGAKPNVFDNPDKPEEDIVKPIDDSNIEVK